MAQAKEKWWHRDQVYTDRELLAINNADRVVVRARTSSGWAEEEFFLREGQTIGQRLAEVEFALKQCLNNHRAIVYVGGMVNGERMVASVKRR